MKKRVSRQAAGQEITVMGCNRTCQKNRTEESRLECDALNKHYFTELRFQLGIYMHIHTASQGEIHFLLSEF